MLGVFLFILIVIGIVSVFNCGKRARYASAMKRPSVCLPSPSLNDPLLWAGKGVPLTVGTYRIQTPDTYICHGITSWEEASCIYTRLPVGTPYTQPQELGYYPQYKNMSPDQRAYYLDWMAKERKTPLGDIGYAFVFFYGLERRALVEDTDIETVLTEANRLLFYYSGYRSFFGYVSRFIAFVTACVGLECLPDESFRELFLTSLKEYDELTLGVTLAWHIKHSFPLPPALAFEIMRNDIRASRSVVITRVPKLFKDLFLKKYATSFGTGMQLKASARDRIIQYRPASPTLFFNLSSERRLEAHISNVLGLSSQFKPLLELWDACIEELKPLSRQVGKEGDDTLTRETYRTLPDMLKKGIDHPDKPKWEDFVSAHTDNGNLAFATAGELATLHGFSESAKLTSQQSKELALMANDVGFALVPDPRITECSYKWQDMVALFRPETDALLPTDNRYRVVILLLEMGIAVAAADGTIEASETEQIITFLKSQFLLTPNDTRRVDAYTEVLLKKPPELVKLGKRLQDAIAAENRETVCRFLVGVAAANGTLDKREKRVLRRFYKAMGVSEEKLNDVVASLFQAAPDTVVVQLGNEPPGEPIPPKPLFVLDKQALQSILHETEQVAQLLNDALSPDNDGAVLENEFGSTTCNAEEVLSSLEVGKSDPFPEIASSEISRFQGLDTRYHAILMELLTRDEWTSDEFSTLARKHTCMPDGLVESINSWADEFYGDFLIEENGTYTVHRNLLEETHV